MRVNHQSQTANRNSKAASPRVCYDQLHDPAMLRHAWRLVQLGGPAGGVDAVNVDQFARSAGGELLRIAERLREQRYRFQPVRRAKISKPDGGLRTLGIPTISDRIVGQAMRLVIEPSLEPHLASASYAYRPDRDVHRAIDKLLEYRRTGHHWCLESDVKDYFDSIVHSNLIRLLGEHLLWPAPTNVDRLEREIDQITRENRRMPLAGLLDELNPLVRSFAHYYRNCQVQGLYERLDCRIRRRLLPHVLRCGRRRPRNLDHWRALNLVSMTEILLSSEPRERTPASYGGFSGGRSRKSSASNRRGSQGSGKGQKILGANNRPPRHRK